MNTESANNNDDITIPWPRAGDVLFQFADDWWCNACLNYGVDSWELYAIGYKDAADALCESVFKTGRHADSFIYPIAFLYRHYLELRLKEVIAAGQALLDQTPDLKHIHKIDVLWRSCRKILEEVWPDSPRDDLDAVENCIRQFSQVDPESMSFRYPITKDGTATLPNLQHINVRNLKEVMARISSLLDGASSAISAYLDHKCSMERDFQGGY